MAPKFGTSGLRGLVKELTGDCVGDHIRAFVASCDIGSGLFVGHDLRDSSLSLAEIVKNAARGQGVDVVMCGTVPTPALALAAMRAGAGAVMITGSHIPADRNGLKFYTPGGEITKADEKAIVAAVGGSGRSSAQGAVSRNDMVGNAYADRYISAFGPALGGMRIGIYAHSAVGRDLMCDLLRVLGADVIELGRSDHFVPVDTEAVSADIRTQLRVWAAENPVDAIISTDADGDRPLLTDAEGEIVPGDILGQITGEMIGAKTVITPVSSNTGVEVGGRFADVARTRIGSPYVIAAMEDATGAVVGYEANGGFLLGFDAMGPAGALPALMTRDAALPILGCLSAARGVGVANLVARQPARFTAADRLQGVDTTRSHDFIAALCKSATKRADFLICMDGAEASLDDLDGLRITLVDQRIVHLRPSGNAPELRLYVEAGSKQAASETLASGLTALREIFGLGGQSS
ncbi:phosphomannomutase [Yoonia sp. 2307UL14-13]|uniref:phosphomannomutase n=1 Tax=Yoonia sp. 2307UL14-13 TaxID=3126506 RepID=UPI0030A7438E